MSDIVQQSLSKRLRVWIAEVLADGHPVEDVMQSLSALGFDDQTSMAAIAEIRETPAFAVAANAARSRDKLASLLEALAILYRHTSPAVEVPVMERPDSVAFREKYYYGNRPVVIRGLMRHWPALRKWTPEWLGTNYGSVEVEVTADRDSDPRYEDNFDSHRQVMTLKEFITRIAEGSGNDLYLVPKNKLLRNPALADLLSDFDKPKGFLRAGVGGHPKLWLGPEGTVTPLHHDLTNHFLAQVYGYKKVKLIPPLEIANIYNDRTYFSAVDVEAADLERYPRFRDVAVLHVTIGPGDFLFLPVGWWHSVRSLSDSISLTLDNLDIDGPLVRWSEARPRTAVRT